MKPFTLFLFSIITLLSSSSNAQRHERNIKESPIFNTKYTIGEVWDSKRSPSFPIAGRDWFLSGLKAPMDASANSTIDWGRFNDRYLMLGLEDDRFNRQTSMTDDITNSRRKYTITLSLFERNGRLVKTISSWGTILGIGSGGFMYLQEGILGTFFPTVRTREGLYVNYRTDIAQVRYLSELSNRNDAHRNDQVRNEPAFNDSHRNDQVQNEPSYNDSHRNDQVRNEPNHNKSAYHNSGFLNTKYGMGEVWDAQRYPSYPIMGSDWRLSGLKAPFDAGTNLAIDFGRFNDRYLKFVLTDDNYNRPGSLVDNVHNSRVKSTVSLNLYDRNGRIIKTVSRWGQLIGFGSGGFMYVQEGQLGTYFAIGRAREGGAISYRPELDEVKYISQLQ